MIPLPPSAALSPAPAPLAPGRVVAAPSAGAFDFMTVDPARRRILAAHAKAGALTVLDLETGAVREVATGPVNGVRVSAGLGRIFCAGANEELVAIDSATLKVVGRAKLTGPGDDVAVDERRNEVYVCHDDGTEDWVFDGATLALKGTVAIEEAPEVLEYDAKSDRFYQNIKSTDHLLVLDPATRKVVATYPTAPMTSPHGLALDRRGRRAYAAGKNGKLVVLDMDGGKILGTVEVGTGIDGIALDPDFAPGEGRLYLPGTVGGERVLTVVAITASGARAIGSVPVAKGVHSCAVDPKTHAVWTPYGDATGAHLAEYLPAK